MSKRLSFVAFIILMAIGCGGSENDAPKHDPGTSSPQTGSGKQPKKESAAARVQSLLHDYLHLLKSTIEELNQITNEETALSAAKQLHENANVVKEIAKGTLKNNLPFSVTSAAMIFLQLEAESCKKYLFGSASALIVSHSASILIRNCIGT